MKLCQGQEGPARYRVHSRTFQVQYEYPLRVRGYARPRSEGKYTLIAKTRCPAASSEQRRSGTCGSSHTRRGTLAQFAPICGGIARCLL